MMKLFAGGIIILFDETRNMVSMNAKKIIAMAVILIIAISVFCSANADVSFTLVKNMHVQEVHDSTIAIIDEGGYGCECVEIGKEEFNDLNKNFNLQMEDDAEILICVNVIGVENIYFMVWGPSEEIGYLYASELTIGNLGWRAAMSAAYGVYCELPIYYFVMGSF